MAIDSEEIWQRIGKITAVYPLLECDKCAITAMRWLAQWQVEGKVLRLRTRRRSEVFITSNRHGNDESITENGTHYGVEVRGRVFDNLSEEGLTRDAWVKDFNCLSGQFVVDEVDWQTLTAESEA